MRNFNNDFRHRKRGSIAHQEVINRCLRITAEIAWVKFLDILLVKYSKG